MFLTTSRRLPVLCRLDAVFCVSVYSGSGSLQCVWQSSVSGSLQCLAVFRVSGSLQSVWQSSVSSPSVVGSFQSLLAMLRMCSSRPGSGTDNGSDLTQFYGL